MNAPLIVHVVHRFDYGGLENGLVNLINRMSAACGRHVVIALTEATEIQNRIERPDVAVHALHKRPGKDFASYVRLYRLLRALKPDIVHTRNFGTLDCQVVAWLARVPRRFHGEHGWDVHDPDGRVVKYRVIRRLLSPLIDRFVALSGELQDWLVQVVGIPERKVVRICNGVDVTRFMRPSDGERDDRFVVGSVTRFSEIKDPLNTVAAFVESARARPGALRLLMIGDGPLKDRAAGMLTSAGLQNDCCLPGSVLDVAPYLASMNVFVLGSLREGISNTVLEAMASGLPVVATNVGGNAELVEHGTTGFLVAAHSSDELAAAILTYADDPALARRHGAAGRRRVQDLFSVDAMVAQYVGLYAGASTKRAEA